MLRHINKKRESRKTWRRHKVIFMSRIFEDFMIGGVRKKIVSIKTNLTQLSQINCAEKEWIESCKISGDICLCTIFFFLYILCYCAKDPNQSQNHFMTFYYSFFTFFFLVGSSIRAVYCYCIKCAMRHKFWVGWGERKWKSFSFSCY